jgi:excisionase family DNA binding protein
MVSKLLDAKEVAKILGVSASTAHGLAREGQISFRLVGARSRRLAMEDVQEFIGNSRQQAFASPPIRDQVTLGSRWRRHGTA